ncbi:PRC-barrel domain-containing protein [Rhodospirillaceae bacterium SYSU D60014]|uniref:PRC-barrel domain-containing protein n=1 Tax=Virgifigura deserti TaxID=2268457 RepID=UPI000E664F3F
MMKLDFLSTTTAIATVLVAFAFAPAQAQDTESSEAQNTASKDPIDITTWNYSDLYAGWSVENFLDADVYDEDGEEIGEVEDLVVNPDGQVEELVIEAGGFLDIGDAHFTYPWQNAEIVSPDRVEVEFDDENIESYSLFGDVEGESVGPRSWRITELIDDYAALDEGVRYGWVDDVIISQQGEIQAVVVQPDVTYGVGGPYAWPYYGYDGGFDPGLDYYKVPYTEDEVADLGIFDYDQLEGGAVAEVEEGETAE